MYFQQAYCVGRVLEDQNNFDMTVEGTITDIVDDNVIKYIAASPPDYRYSYSGSALPFASPLQAFEGTPNKGQVQLSGNKFSIKLLFPNSYYMGLGTTLIPPTLSLFYNSGGEEKILAIQVANTIPFRLLTYPSSFTYKRDSPMFYEGNDKLPIRTQEQIFRSSTYPPQNHTPKDFWGLKPRH